MIKGSEGIVLAADSRVTLFNQVQRQPVANSPLPPPTFLLPATFDSATKVFTVRGQTHVGAVTYGLGALLTPSGPRTMQSFIPELEQEMASTGEGDPERLSVADFAETLRAFFVRQWNTYMNRPPNLGEEINFLVGGYNEGEAHGRTFNFVVPNDTQATEQNAGPGQFGIVWGGQHDLVSKMLSGYDPELPGLLRTNLNLTPEQSEGLNQLLPRFVAGIPYQFLPLQDAIDLATFLIESTISYLKFRTTVVRGVGGAVEVATITRAGVTFVSQKSITVRGRQI